MTRFGERKTGKMSAWLAVAAFAAVAVGGMALAARTAETAPAPRPQARVTASPGLAGGIQADVRGLAEATLYATRTPDGRVSVECADAETAAAMVYGAQP
jgi:hypothetical protein